MVQRSRSICNRTLPCLTKGEPRCFKLPAAKSANSPATHSHASQHHHRCRLRYRCRVELNIIKPIVPSCTSRTCNGQPKISVSRTIKSSDSIERLRGISRWYGTYYLRLRPIRCIRTVGPRLRSISSTRSLCRITYDQVLEPTHRKLKHHRLTIGRAVQ